MNIVIYTIPDCPYSKELKEYLTLNSIAFTEKDVSNDKDNLSEMLDASDKFAGVPFTLLTKDSGEKIALKGFTKSDFDAALGLSKGTEGTGGDALKSEPAVSTPAKMDTLNADPIMPNKQDMPIMSVDSAMPAAPAMPAVPVMSDMSMSTASRAVAPAPTFSAPTSTQSTPPAPTSTPATAVDPQAELNSLLKDLESKVGQNTQMGSSNSQPAVTIPTVPTMDGSMNTSTTDMSQSTPAMPVAPVTPPAPPAPAASEGASTPATPSGMPSVPDFGTKL